MKQTKRLRLRLAAAAALLTAALAPLALPAGASAQWTAPDANNNINNTNSGKVGVGTAAPDTKAHVVISSADADIESGSTPAHAITLSNSSTAAGNYSGLVFSDGAGQGTFAGLFGINTDHANNYGDLALLTRGGGGYRERLRVTNAGNVGVGAASPNYKLVVGPRMQDGFSYAAMTVSKGAGQNASVVVGAGGSSLMEFGWDQGNARGFVNAPGTTPMAFTQDGGNVRMFISSEGSVGIGTAAPTSADGVKLDVNGSVNVSGNISARYQDVAEWVPSTQRLQAGTVVTLDTGRVNHVLASASAYDTKVAGVVSAQPGVILGEGGEGKVMVATTGRVKVRVDATRGAIRVGDLLVTSDAEGVAMKSLPVDLGGTPIHRPGTIIGKALEPLAGGVGEILVLLSLQ